MPLVTNRQKMAQLSYCPHVSNESRADYLDSKHFNGCVHVLTEVQYSRNINQANKVCVLKLLLL
jgi:hypothetical protein